MRAIHGSYIASGIAGHEVSVALAGARLKVLFVQRSGVQLVFRFDIGGDLTFSAGATAGEAGVIPEITSSGFVLGVDPRVNEAGSTYHYWGLVETGARDIVTGTYVGNLTIRDVTDAGLSGTPAFVLVKGDTAQNGVWKTTDMPGDRAMVFSFSGITWSLMALINGGFTAGLTSYSNDTGVTYYYCAALAVPGVLSTLAYVGNDVDDRSITGAWFAPDVAMAQGNSGSAGWHRTPPMTAALWPGGISSLDAIQALEADGIQIGADANPVLSINQTGVDYYTLFLRDNVVPPVVSLSSTPAADLLAAVEAGRLAWLHEVDLPDGTTLRSSIGGYSSIVTGHYEARVVAWEGWRVGWSDDGVAAPEMHVELADPDGALATLLRGRYQRQIEAGVASRVLLAALDGSGTRLLAWSGVTVRPEITATNVVRFGGRVDDRALRVPTPRRLLGPSWPYADAEVREIPGPAVYGLHDGGALGLEAGQVPALLADSLANVYVAAGGAADGVIRVYDGSSQVAPAGYTAALVTRKGWLWQAITFAATPSGDVTVDMNGAEDVGDGSGAVITNPVEQLAHYLSNRVLEQATSSAWLATSARLDAASLAALTAWIATRLYGSEGTSYYRGEPVDAYSVLREWQESLEVRAWWQADGTLAFGVWPHDGDPYFATLVVRWASHDLTGTWAPRADDRDLATGLRVRHAPRAAAGGYLATLDVLDPEAARSDVDELPMPWSCAG